MNHQSDIISHCMQIRNVENVYKNTC